jgi:lysine-specific demethylase 3
VEADKKVVIDCQSEKIKETSVGKFFEMFKDPEQRTKGVWKLKVSVSTGEPMSNGCMADEQDWPSAHDFQSAYPDLYNDFCDSLPVPDFTRREGVLNLYAHVCTPPSHY